MPDRSEVLILDAIVPTVTFDVDGVATDATGTPTVTAVNLAGTAVTCGAVSHVTDAADLGSYQTSIAARTTPDVLTLTWVATVSAVQRTRKTYVTVVGGHYFSLLSLRNSNPGLALFTAAQLAAARQRAEADAEQIMGVAFIPRATSERIIASMGDAVAVSRGRVRSVRSLSVNGTARAASTVADLLLEGSTIRGSWANRDVLDIVYEHGYDYAPADVSDAVMALTRARVQASASAIPDRAGRFVVDSGRTFMLDQAGPGKVGIPEVDAVFGRYRAPGIA